MYCCLTRPPAVSIILGEHGQQEVYPPPNVSISEPTSALHLMGACLPHHGAPQNLAPFSCVADLYRCLPANWTGTCSWGSLPSQVDTVPSNPSLPIPSLADTQSERVVQVLPLLVGLGVTAPPGIGTGGRASSYYYKQRSENLAEDTEWAANSVMSRETTSQQGYYRTRGAQTASLL